MAKVGASAAIKKKTETPVQVVPVAQPAAVGRPLVTATVGPVQTYTQPVNNGFAMTPQTTTAVAGPVQQGTSTPEEIQAARALALDNLRQRAQTKAQAAVDYKLNKLNKQNSQAQADYRRQFTDFNKEAERASTRDLLSWLADYKAYRDSGSWDETQRYSLASRAPVIGENFDKYGANNSYLKYTGYDSKASLLDTLNAASKTLEGPQILKDVYSTEEYRQNPFSYFPNWQAKSDTLFNQGASLDTYGYDRNDFITPLEAQNYEWLYENRGEAAAEEYRKSLNDKNDTSYANWLEEKFNPGYAAEHPVAASVTSVLGTYGAPLAFLENTIATARGEDINPNSWANAMANQRTQLRNEVSKNIDSNAGRFLYNTGMSIGDNLALMPLNALGGAGEMAMLGTLGASAANDRTRELMSQGASSQEAYMRGLVSGAIEGITEKIGLDNLLKTAWKGGAASVIRNIAKQATAEGLEEGVSNVMNLAADTIASVVKQEGVGPLEQEIQALEKKGASRSEATSQVILGHLKDLGMDVAGGALSGAVMGGGATAFNYNSLVNQGRNLATNEDGTVNMDAVQALIERGNNMPADTISHRQAELLEQKIREGRAVTAREAAVLYANNVSAEQNMPYEELLKLRKKEADPGEWQAAKDEAMEHADELNRDVRQLYERTVEEAVTNGATGKQAIAEFDRAYTSGFNKLRAPQTAYISENTVQEIMQAARVERTGTAASTPLAASTRSTTNAEQILNRVNNYEKNGAQVYPEAVREALNNGATAEEARVAFNEVYRSGYDGTQLNTNVPMSASTIADIRQAAIRDKFTAQNTERANAVPESTNTGISTSDAKIRDAIINGRISPDTLDFADEMGKLFGEEVSLVSTLPQNGLNDLRNNQIVVAMDTEFGGIINRDQAMRATLGHELAHRMRQVSPKTWDKFTQAVIGADIDQFNAAVNKMIKDTYKGEITRDAAQEEVLADYIGNRFFSGDIGSLRTMVESIDSLPQRSGFIQHIVDMASWIKSKLTGQPASNATRIETEFRKMFKETQAKIQQTEAQARPSGEEIRYSMKESANRQPGIRDQIVTHASELAKMEPVADVRTIDGDYKKIALETAKQSGYKVFRQGFQTIDLSENTLKDSFKYVYTAAEKAAYQALPKVLKKGIEVGDHENHKSRGYDAITFAAPITIDGVDCYMGATVKLHNGKYKAHRVVAIDPELVNKISTTPNGQGAAETRSHAERKGGTKNNVPQKQSDFNAEIQNLEATGVDVSADGDMFTKESRRTWDATDKDKIKTNLLKMGFNEAEVSKWINDVNGVASIIAADTDRLDYFASPNQKFLKANGDYYKKTLDASTLCAKRLLYQGTFDAIQHQLPNTPLLAEDVIRLRQLMKDMDHEVPCGICYVESRRKALGKYASDWLNNYDGEYIPTLDQVTTSDGLEALRTEHPQTYNDFVKAMKAKGTASPKVVELRTEYREDLKNLPQTSVDYLNSIGGLRINSFSDFETPHLIDFMQAVMDMAGKGLKGMAYTKVPAFAWVFGDTGIKINMSLIVKTDANGNVVRDDNGRIVFDEREGINPEEAQRLREAYPNNVGTIAVAKDMENTLELLNDDRVDFVIPFHRNGWSKAEYVQLGLKGYSDFATGHQETGIYPSQYWDYSKTGKENAEEYLRRCAEAGITPVFEQLLVENEDGSYSLKADGSTDNYWKLLVEGRMYNNEGVGVQQQAVKPNFNMERAMDVLNSYNGDPNRLPVATDVVDAYVKEYKEAHSDQVKFSRRASDAEYMAAVEANDTETLRKMVAQAANEAGYTTEAFHGTNAKFNRFKPGSHFGSTVYQALDRLGFYNDILDEYEDDPDVQELLNRAKSTGANVLNLYIKADNPVRVSDFGSWDADVLAERMAEYLPSIDWANINTVKDAFDEMMANGYDSIVYENTHEGRDEDEGVNDAYILFDPKQAKLADPVTYDDNGNVIPLSERFNTENPDIRYSKKSSSSKDAVIRRQQETIDRLRHEMVETHGVEPDPKAIATAAVQFGRDWQSTMPETEIKDAFADIAKEFALYRRLNNQGADPALIRSVEARFNDKCTELANKVVKSAAVLVGDNARAQELKQFVWQHPIQIDPSFKKEFGDYRALQAAAKGRIKFAKDGMPISRLYESLNEQFSDYPLFQEFEGETLEPVDMLLDLLDLINDFDKAYNPYDTADAVDAVAAEIMNTIFDAPISRPTFADRKAAEVNAARAETAQARADLEQARKRTPADIKAYYEAKLNDIRDQRDRYLADLVQAYKDRNARAKESEERARLLRIMKRLDRMAKKSSDARRAEIKDIVGNFDLISQRLSNHKAQELSELADWVRRNKDNADTIITPQIADKLARLDKQHISDLRIGDVRAITEALMEIEHRIRTENRIIGLRERYNTVDLGKQIIQDVRNAPGVGSSALARGMDKFLINGLMRPETEFLRLVGFNKNSPLYEYTFGDRLSLLTGQRTMQDYQREANEHYFRQFLDDKDFMKSITGKNARAIEITGTDEQGKQHTVKVTPDFVMAMYMHSQNVQNLMHIVNYTDEFGREVKAGGMTVPDYKLYKDGKKTEAYNAGTKLTFTRSQFMDQLKGLTPKEMEFIRAAQRYYSEMSQPRINDVSEKLLGYSLAKVDNYFRINTDPDYRGGDMENIRYDGTIEGMGWTKERVNGKNPILLIPLSEQLQKDIVAHSKYVGMAIPVRNFSKIYGITENTYTQNENGRYELQNAYASSVIKEINKKHPSGADTNYIRDLMADIQNPSSNMSALDKVFAALRSKYAGSVLTLNLGVALKQAASFPTAAAEIGWGPILKTVPQFVKAMGGFAKPMNQKTIDFISKYSPLMRLRTEGMSTQELADMQRLNHKIPGVLNWIQNVDVGTVAALWKASEEYVKQNFKDLKPGSEEFYQKVGDVHTRVITKTQPNYSELQRPGLLRSKSEIVKTLMMFKTQPFQNFNILYEAAGSFKAAERAYKANPSAENKAARDEARKRLAWAVSSQVVSNSVFAAMQVIWDIIRRKEDPLDDEDKAVQRLNNFFKNVLSSWAGMVPGGSQALEVVQKWVDDALVAMGGEKYFDNKVYGFELDASIEGLNKLVDLITNVPNLGGDIFGLIKGDENKEEYIRDLFNQFKDISTFFGLPTNNVMNLTKATMEWAMTKGLGYSDEEARYLADRYLNGVNNSTYSKKHYAELAIAAGEETMQMFRDDPAFDTDSKSAAEYLQEMQTKAEKEKFAEEYGNKEIYVADRDSVTEEAFREFAEKYAQTNDGNGSRSAHDILTALAAADLSDEEKEAIYDLYDYKTPYEKAAGKVEAEATAEPAAEEPVASTAEMPTRTPLGQARPQGTFTSEVSVGNSQAPTPINKTSTRIRYSKDEMLNVYGANEMYLDTNPLKGDRLDEFNRAYAAVTDNNDSVSQKELAAALNAMGVSLEEGEQIWAAYSQAHADKWGDGWKKTYANYYSGGSGGSGGSSGGSAGSGRSSGSGGGRSSGGGGSSRSSASTQPVVGPYPGYSENPAAAYQPAAQSSGYVQPVAMPEPVASAPQTPYTGLRSHSEGGNVDLTFRPVLRAVELRRKGWGGVLSDTVRNFIKSYAGNGKALNFTPIVLDKDGNYVRTLSPNELREYAEAVLKGEREDDLKLQVGTAYEGSDALAQAEKAAAEIEKLDKDYTQTT